MAEQPLELRVVLAIAVLFISIGMVFFGERLVERLARRFRKRRSRQRRGHHNELWDDDWPGRN